ncbi:MAG: O-linked GlcNAc transferase [Pirellulaceae bacterium]|jgi:tetratricopeptide (TPR) repeat protein|nr:O-linked GlcNAc transferase [Pirellulaceae bacterium]
MASENRATELTGKSVAFAGKLGGVNRRQASQLVRDLGGVPLPLDDERVDLIVVGADAVPPADSEEMLPERARRRVAAGKADVITETQFWDLLGYFEEGAARRLYTPAMLAEWLDVPIAAVRRWIRRRLISPVREVHRLPYFDFQEVASARNLAKMLAAGASPADIERNLEELARYVPDIERPLHQLSVIVEGRKILLRRGEGLLEPGGQRRFDFEAIDGEDAGQPPTLSLESKLEPAEFSTPDEFADYAAALEEEGDLEGAIEAYRTSLCSGGPHAETCFQLAELLYRTGDLNGARERYYNSIELDEEYVEARHNLGCLLAEIGQVELAVAAFQGALTFHADYPDAHYQLAKTLDHLGERERAEEHWRSFLLLAPSSPWATEARCRLE